MKKLISKILILVFLLSLTVTPLWAGEEVAKDKLTLNEVKELVLKNARTIKSTEKSIDQIEAQSYLAYNAYAGIKGQLNSQYTVGKLSDVQAAMSQIESSGEFNPNNPPAQWYTLMLQKQMLESGIQQANSIGISKIEQARMGYDRARDGLEDAKRSLEDLEKMLELRTELLYTSILNLENTLHTLEMRYDAGMNKVKALRLQYELGMVTIDQVKDIEVMISDLAKTIKSLKELNQKNKWALNDLMGREIASKLELVGFTAQGPFPAENMELVLEQALENNATLPILERRIRDYDRDGEYTDDTNQIAILTASIDKTKLSIEDTKQSIRENVKVLVANHEAKAKSYQLAEVSLNTAKQTFDWAKKKYDLGVISKLDFEDSEIAYYEKLNEKVNAGYDYMLARNAVELAKLGIIDAQYIGIAQASLQGR